MRLWIDCEFNSYKGQLMSLALVGEGDVQFYAVLPGEGREGGNNG